MTAKLFSEDQLPPPPAVDETADSTPLVGRPRLRRPERQQVEMHCDALDDLLDPEHSARLVWQAVSQCDLSRWLRHVKAVEHAPGRNMTDPRLLLAVWIYATLDGVGSARKIAELCTQHIVYRWLCGGVTLNHHTLSDFRRSNDAAWIELLTQLVAALLATGLVQMNCVAQDGMRVRANAGGDTFRRRETLQRCLQQARAQVEALQAEQDDDDEPSEQSPRSPRQRAARERAAREREQRLTQALAEVEKLQAERDERAKKGGKQPREARASTTDPEARVMKMPDGGYRPAYNVQFATDVETGVIVGVDVVQDGSDFEQLPPMIDQLRERYGKVPQQWLADCGFASLAAVDQADAQGCTVYAPLRDEERQLNQGTNPYEPKRNDSPAVAAWRQRMGTAAAQALYKLRCKTAEWVNAMARNRGLWQMPLRGLANCRRVGHLYAITHTLIMGAKLRAQCAVAA